MSEAKEIGTSLSVAIAALLFGSTMILSAVGPARANDTTVLAHSHMTHGTARYLA
jgi:hypothetical protein